MPNRKTDERERVEELAATSNDILETVGRLKGLEKQRRQVDVSTPEFHRLAGEIETASKRIFRGAVKETTLAETIETTDETLDEVSQRDSTS